MRAGSLDREITIQKSVTYIADAGVPQETWTAICTLRAEVIESSTDEYIRGAGASSETAIVFRTRYFPGVTVAHRIMFGGEPLDIKQVKELGRQNGLELRAERKGVS